MLLVDNKVLASLYLSTGLRYAIDFMIFVDYKVANPIPQYWSQVRDRPYVLRGWRITRYLQSAPASNLMILVDYKVATTPYLSAGLKYTTGLMF